MDNANEINDVIDRIANMLPYGNLLLASSSTIEFLRAIESTIADLQSRVRQLEDQLKREQDKSINENEPAYYQCFDPD